MTEAANRRMTLLRAALEMTRELDRDAAWRSLVQGALTVIPAGCCLGYSISTSGDDLECRAAAWLNDSDPRWSAWAARLTLLDAALLRHLAPDGPVVLRSPELLLANVAHEDPARVGSVLAAPLRDGGSAPALLLLLADEVQGFSAEDLQLAAEYAAAVVPALENLRALDGLRELLIRDDTADCFNRRFLDHSLELEVERSRRFGGRFALIFIDIDNLKVINTDHGHSAGSRALYEASLRMTAVLRSIDHVFRYGGDEFVALLPGTDLEGGREAAERIRRSLAEAPLPVAAGITAPLTASIGVAAWPEHGPTARSMLAAGDEAMRRIKESCKNAVAVAATNPA